MFSRLSAHSLPQELSWKALSKVVITLSLLFYDSGQTVNLVIEESIADSLRLIVPLGFM